MVDQADLGHDSLLHAVGSRVEKARVARGWTQKNLADESGVHRVTIAKLEAGKLDVRLTTLKRLVDALALDVADVFGP